MHWITDMIRCSCYEQLVQLKRQFPDRVVLLAGNRDVNKIRFTSELSDAEMPLTSMARGLHPTRTTRAMETRCAHCCLP